MFYFEFLRFLTVVHKVRAYEVDWSMRRIQHERGQGADGHEQSHCLASTIEGTSSRSQTHPGTAPDCDKKTRDRTSLQRLNGRDALFSGSLDTRSLDCGVCVPGCEAV